MSAKETDMRAVEADVLRGDLPFQIAAGLIPAAGLAMVLGINGWWDQTPTWWTIAAGAVVVTGTGFGLLARRRSLKTFRAMGARYQAEEDRLKNLLSRAQTDADAAKAYVQELEDTLAELQTDAMAAAYPEVTTLIAQVQRQLIEARQLPRGAA